MVDRRGILVGITQFEDIGRRHRKDCLFSEPLPRLYSNQKA
jgi:hypothetical protein